MRQANVLYGKELTKREELERGYQKSVYKIIDNFQVNQSYSKQPTIDRIELRFELIPDCQNLSFKFN